MQKEGFKFNKIISDIKSIKIQGAENVAKAGIKAYLIKPNEKSKKKILSIRETEPLLQNALKIISNSKNKKQTSNKFLSELKKSHSIIAKHGATLIKNNMKIYTHCHSSTVIDIIKFAKKQGKKFEIYTTEVEPHLQGRMTAKELSKLNIKVNIAPDLSQEQMLKQCDLFLFGADAYTPTAIYNKIGTSTLCKLAKVHNIPRYSCGVSMKITPKIKIEQRKGKDVWDQRNKNIIVWYSAFDKTPSKNITGIISEFGIKTYKQFYKLAKKKLQKM